MAHPKTTKHSRLGDLTRCDLTDVYEGSIAVPGLGAVALSVNIDDDEALGSLLDGAARTLGQALARIQEARSYTATKLAPVHNEGWSDGGTEITEAEFARRIKLEMVEVDSGGSVVLHFDDDDLFWGHSIRVEGDGEEGFTNAYFEG